MHRTATERLGWLFGLVMAAGSAQAQSGYTMTTLNVPSGQLGVMATAMQASGMVVGFQQVRQGTVYAAPGDFGTLVDCPFGCAGYTTQVLSWGPETAASVSPQLGSTYFAPTQVNARGSLLGFTVSREVRKLDLKVPVTPQALLPSSLGVGRGLPSVLIDGKRTTISPFQAGAILPDNTLLGGSTLGDYDPPDGLPETLLPALRTVVPDGVSITTRQALPAPYLTGRFLRANAVGDTVGQVATGAQAPWLPALWQAGQLQILDVPAGFEPVALNDARQVLLQAPAPNGQAGVWFNGGWQPIQSAGRKVYATAMNQRGTVVGCTQAPATMPRRADNSAFLWRQGVLQDLTQELASKGVKLPSGTRLGCPVAINDQGTILAYTYRTLWPDSVTWVRFNARP